MLQYKVHSPIATTRMILEGLVNTRQLKTPGVRSLRWPNENELRIQYDPGVPGEVYSTAIYLTPLVDETTRLQFVNDPEEPSREYLGERVIREELSILGYMVTRVRDGENLGFFDDHSFVQPTPQNIPNPKHRAIIRAFIQFEISGSAGWTYEDIAVATEYENPQTGEVTTYSISRISEIRKLYLKPEIREREEKIKRMRKQPE